MQFDKDVQSKHKDLFLKVRNVLLEKTELQKQKKSISQRILITTKVYVTLGPCLMVWI